MNTSTLLCLAICGFMLINYSSSLPACDRVHPERMKDCQILVRRWYELKDQYFKKCCEESKATGCPDCEAAAKRDATAKIKAEKKAARDAEKLKTKNVDAIVPVSIDDRIALGFGNRRTNVFRNTRH
ncbi:uncharacterized protein LOC132794983 [Drosophila nasuta]|uniref:uncharacterized protein LOC132794983 n=1 Tax=Drosophila nasuta TaxID=42062 RepID=UPI00295F32C2|nr:uncharacterized protein LOC132794983 [Drosophila nasuta]